MPVHLNTRIKNYYVIINIIKCYYVTINNTIYVVIYYAMLNKQKDIHKQNK